MLTFAALLIALAVIPPLEARFGPRPRSRPIRANLVLVPIVLAASAVFGLVEVASLDLVESRGFGLIPWLGLDGAAALVVALIGLDLVAYTGHRIRHRFSPLWAMHRTHHTDLDVDVTTTLRHHPGDIAMLVVMGALGMLVLGCTAAHVAAFAVPSLFFEVFDHVRFQLPLRVERVLGLVFQTPGLHRVHHSPNRVETDSNFGLVLTLWDRLFGTFTPVSTWGEVGLDTLDIQERQSVGAMLLEPWRPMVRPAPAEPVAPVEPPLVSAGVAGA